MLAFLTTDGMTVETDPAYSQYLQFHNTSPDKTAKGDVVTGELTPICSMADTHDTAAECRHTV